MTTSAKAVAAAYYDAWRAKDFDTLATLLAPDMTFQGALGSADDAESCLAGLRGMAAGLEDIVVHGIYVDPADGGTFEKGTEVVTWFDLRTKGAPPVTTANRMHITDGKITASQAVFDPRPILAARG